ncbi:hypothetical protein M3I54_39340 [Paraburkholderia sp. CNPSo 3274]|uniref:hypothetical protein n=1 Tax=Paraburkholderia sp. CNPSo 3274 TaxID=2940932 RepID=UPI0020B8D563|nr:hypothetical protein [Paraburkholderia sp. CNPSo 3274]MCP3712883.1 hypothetical protein [Paraburkholderia sp. CNPSo 3274]
MENPAAAANERARRRFADRPVARESGRTSSFAPKELHAHLRKGVGVRDDREREVGVLAAVHFGVFHAQAATGPWRWQYILSIVPEGSDETHICKNA